ncbi:MAG: hypothetical protein HY609_04160 [Deltaproteobacteria bacterium]|nr:hypothetical protein [Deltaproteobacteria bacterium]MBI4224103.1 hypothetical protein [Deltaproteobacteria bacterium]
MLNEFRAIKTEKKQLRQFAVLAVIVFAGLAFRNTGFAVPAFLAGLLGWLWPAFFKPFYLVWMGIAVVLGNIVSRIVLFITFYGVVTPMGLLMRLFGKGFIQPKGTITYWISRDDFSSKPEKYERQF